MNKNKLIDADKIHILNIRTIRGNIESPTESDVAEVDGHVFGYDLKTALNGVDKMIGLKLQVDITAVGKKAEQLPVTGSYTHEMIFFIENLDDFVETKDGAELIDAALGSTLASIIYSTVRGIIYSRTQGTSLGVVILPVIAPLKLMGIDTTPKGQSDRVEEGRIAVQSDKKPRKAAKTNKVQKG